MRCPACGSSNPEDARFCRSCGVPIAASDGGTETVDATLHAAAPPPTDPPVSTGPPGVADDGWVTPSVREEPPEPAPDDDRVNVPVGAIVAVVAILVVALIGFFAFTGGGDSESTAVRGERYPQAVRENFMRSCTAQSAPSETCACMLDAIEQRLSIDEFIQLESQLNDPQNLPPVFVDAITSCL